MRTTVEHMSDTSAESLPIRSVLFFKRFLRPFALDDCLTDLEWLSFSSLLLVVDRAELLFRDEPDAKVCVNLLKKHLLAAASYWKEQNIKFEVILNTHMSRA